MCFPSVFETLKIEIQGVLSSRPSVLRTCVLQVELHQANFGAIIFKKEISNDLLLDLRTGMYDALRKNQHIARAMTQFDNFQV